MVMDCPDIILYNNKSSVYLKKTLFLAFEQLTFKLKQNFILDCKTENSPYNLFVIRVFTINKNKNQNK